MVIRVWPTALISILALAGCATSSVQMLTGETTVYESEGCRVEVYQSRALAIDAGMTEEVCRVEATTAFSLEIGRASCRKRV